MFPSKNDPNKIFRFRELERDDFGQKDIFCKKIDISKVFLWKKPAPYLTSVRSRHRLRPRQPSPERCRRQLRCRWWRQVHRLHDGVGVVDFCFFPLNTLGSTKFSGRCSPWSEKHEFPQKTGGFLDVLFPFEKETCTLQGSMWKTLGVYPWNIPLRPPNQQLQKNWRNSNLILECKGTMEICSRAMLGLF